MSRYRITASYFNSSLDRFAELDAENPRAAALNAVMKGLIPIGFIRTSRGVEPYFYSIKSYQQHWPEITVTEAKGIITVAWSDQDRSGSFLLSVEEMSENGQISRRR